MQSVLHRERVQECSRKRTRMMVFNITNLTEHSSIFHNMSYTNHFICNVLMKENKKSELKQNCLGCFNPSIHSIQFNHVYAAPNSTTSSHHSTKCSFDFVQHFPETVPICIPQTTTNSVFSTAPFTAFQN
ncbi:Uncharacterized protein APZ42_033443 [Daphnia magna]|uniref:Uncharacterized protein n=1 Tax=Daphnia magna TaxID=35525 RepID=A0A164L401_9CRUS|nr:Uncharacterized protein APZ42_033443 [Daphnia magna]